MIKEKIKRIIEYWENQDPEELRGPILGIFSVFLLIFLVSFQTTIIDIKKSEIFEMEPYFNEELAEKINSMVEDYPMAQMVPFIATKDERTAAYLVAIAKKESNWGERVPVYQGKDCYNYWGYRGISEKMGSGGHTCFDNPEEAVNIVSKRLKYLIRDKELDEPGELVVWKCGYSCIGHSNWAVRKWISDVELYYEKVLN